MTTLREAAQQALEALEWSWGGEPMGTLERDAITALKAALAEPVQDQDVEDAIEAALAATKEHITDGSPCWCNPELNYVDPDTGAKVWVHKEAQ